MISILNKRELLIIKRHPDDKIDYKKIAPDVEIIQEIFPAELLPYIFKGRKRPKVIYTFNSTGIGNLSKKFKIVILENGMKNRALIVVNSTYQLLTAVNIKYKLLKERETDILLTDVTIQLKDYIGNLKETGVFSKVIYGKTFEMNQKYSSGNEPEISECFQKIDSLFRWNLSEKLEKVYRGLFC